MLRPQNRWHLHGALFERVGLTAVMKNLPRRRALALGALFAAPAIVPFRADAETTLPDAQLRILVGFAAGGGGELMARVIAPRLESRTGRRVGIQNRPSGADRPAGDLLRKGLTGGTVVAFMPSTTLAATLAGEVFPFDSRSELVPLTVAGTFQVVLAVSAATGASTFADYVAWAKDGPPERRRLGVSATDAYLGLYGRMLGRAIGVDFKDVPHEGAAPLASALKAGEIPAGLGSITTLLQHNRDRRLRFLMTSGRQRVSQLRDVPTVGELGHPDLELDEWYGFFAASITPAAVATEWNRQLRAVLAETEIVAALAQLGLDVESSTQQQAAARFAAHLAAWKARKDSFGAEPVRP
jgi:tripartite-type tricarboxylate transporter receptor subunit TctC